MIGSVPFHEPRVAVSVLPTCVVPEIVGGDVFVGATAEAADPEPVITPADDAHDDRGDNDRERREFQVSCVS